MVGSLVRFLLCMSRERLRLNSLVRYAHSFVEIFHNSCITIFHNSYALTNYEVISIPSSDLGTVRGTASVISRHMCCKDVDIVLPNQSNVTPGYNSCCNVAIFPILPDMGSQLSLYLSHSTCRHCCT